MGSDESHFNVSLTVRDKVTRRCPLSTTFEEKGEPKRSGVHGWFPLEGGQVVNCWDILSTLTLSIGEFYSLREFLGDIHIVCSRIDIFF